MSANNRITTFFGIGVLALGAACSGPKPAAPPIIYPEPVFDKFGNPDCRPPDQPIGGNYTAALPLCFYPPQDECDPNDTTQYCPPPGDGGDGGNRTPTTPRTPPPPPTGGPVN